MLSGVLVLVPLEVAAVVVVVFSCKYCTFGAVTAAVVAALLLLRLTVVVSVSSTDCLDGFYLVGKRCRLPFRVAVAIAIAIANQPRQSRS